MPTPPIDERSSTPVLIAVEESFIEYLRGLNLGTLESVIAKSLGCPTELIGDPAPNHIVGGTDGN